MNDKLKEIIKKYQTLYTDEEEIKFKAFALDIITWWENLNKK